MSEPQTMSDAEVLAAYQSERCPVCGGVKRPRASFCLTDHLALTVFSRNSLAGGPDDPEFCASFRSAFAHLRLYTTRRRAFPGSRAGWRYRTDDELREAGYRLCDHGWCRVPGCGQAIRWFWGPDNRRIAVNCVNNQPHRTTCANPEYVFPRKSSRALKTSAARPGSAR